MFCLFDTRKHTFRGKRCNAELVTRDTHEQHSEINAAVAELDTKTTLRDKRCSAELVTLGADKQHSETNAAVLNLSRLAQTNNIQRQTLQLLCLGGQQCSTETQQHTTLHCRSHQAHDSEAVKTADKGTTAADEDRHVHGIRYVYISNRYTRPEHCGPVPKLAHALLGLGSLRYMTLPLAHVCKQQCRNEK